jgi:hypothetical protein
VAPHGTKGPRHLYTISSSFSPLSLDLLSLFESSHHATTLHCPPKPSIIIPAPSWLHLVTSWSSTPRPLRPTMHVATTLSSLAPRPCATPICSALASSPARLTPTPRLHSRAAPSTTNYLSPSPPSDEISAVGLAWPIRACTALSFRNAQPAFGTRTHLPCHHRPRLVRALASLAPLSPSPVVLRHPLSSV